MIAPHPLANDAAAHIVQLALTPIFLLTGLASLLNVFSTRLGRIADQVDRLSADEKRSPARLARLRLRSRALDIACLLGAIAGALTCGAGMALFIGELRDGVAGMFMLGLFAGALICAIMALAAFSTEMVLAGHGVRERTEDEAG